MLSKLMNFFKACWQHSSKSGEQSGPDAAGKQDGLLWYKDNGKHIYGDFSMSVVQANSLLEDQSQIESGSLSLTGSGPYGTFVGVYDGHGGPETSRYVNDHLFQNLKRFTSEQGCMSTEVIQKAFQATEEGFLSVVTKQWNIKPQIASVGTCCLIGIICDRTLYIANLGDSRVVLARYVKSTGEVLAVQLSTEHNAAIESVRQELRSLHPDDSKIVVLKHNVWRVKGLIQISRSIGDIYLKKAEFNREPLFAKFRLQETFTKPILSSEPSITVQEIQPNDRFLIFASDGLWDHLSNQEAVDIVQNHPHTVSCSDYASSASVCIIMIPCSKLELLRLKCLIYLSIEELVGTLHVLFFINIKELGSAKRLVKAALQEAAKKREMRYADLKKIDRGVRRHFHDDISVIVVFLDSDLVSRASTIKGPTLSLRGAGLGLHARK